MEDGGGGGQRRASGYRQSSARWEQLRVQVKTGLWKRSDTGFGLGGWSEVRTHPRTGQDSGEAERAGSGREREERRWE